MDVLTDFPERLKPGVTVYAGDQHRPLHIRSARPQNEAMLLAFKEFHTPEEVGELRNQVISVNSEDRPELEEGEYYHHQLLGLQVMDEAGKPLGRLAEILSTGANDVYVVQPDRGAEILFPAIESVILDIDLERGTMRVHVLPGLLSDEQKG